MRLVLVGHVRERHKAWDGWHGNDDGGVSGVRLRVVVRGLSPLIVRVVDVPAETSLASLHGVLLECFGWSGEHLHVFEIRGRSYSSSGYYKSAPASSTTNSTTTSNNGTPPQADLPRFVTLS